MNHENILSESNFGSAKQPTQDCSGVSRASFNATNSQEAFTWRLVGRREKKHQWFHALTQKGKPLVAGQVRLRNPGTGRVDGTSRVTQIIKVQSTYVRKGNQVTLLSPAPIHGIHKDDGNNYAGQDDSAGPDVPVAEPPPRWSERSRKMPQRLNLQR